MKSKVIIDCDPGHDDALAILFALASPSIELIGITTVAGNQTIEKVTLNARRVCTVADAHNIPIAAGSPRPLMRDLRTGEEIHGESGLDGYVFSEPTAEVLPQHAVDFIIETVMTSPGEVVLVATAPLTNIALALRKEPRIAENVRALYIMGGSYSRGNVTPAAEFNIFADPEAATIVLDAAPRALTMFGLDVTLKVLATKDVVTRIERLQTHCSRLVVDLVEHARAIRPSYLDPATPPIHDLCPMMFVAEPSIFTVQEAFIAIETCGQWTAGMTVTDFHGRLGRRANARVATSVDAEALWSKFLAALELLP